MARAHLRSSIKDKNGNVIQNALVYVREVGTETAVADLYAASSGGSPVGSLTSNAQGEVEGWLTTARTVDLRITDNDGEAFYPGSDTTLTGTAFTEAGIDVYPAPEDIATEAYADAAGGVSDHGDLDGLADDDHSQYHNNTRGDARYWQLSTDLATQAELDAHINDAADAHDASAISILDTASDFTATDVEGALAELQSDHEADATSLTDHVNDAAAAHAGTAISFTPAGTIAATTVQAAIEEVASEAGGGSGFTTVTKTIDESVTSSTTVQDDNELFFTATSGVCYEIELVLIYASPAGAGTPDLKFAIGEDNTTRGYLTGAAVNVGDGYAAAVLAMALTSTLTCGTAATKHMVRLLGFFHGNGGSCKVQWAQNTSDANATIVYAGSELRYRAYA